MFLTTVVVAVVLDGFFRWKILVLGPPMQSLLFSALHLSEGLRGACNGKQGGILDDCYKSTANYCNILIIARLQHFLF